MIGVGDKRLQGDRRVDGFAQGLYIFQFPAITGFLIFAAAHLRSLERLWINARSYFVTKMMMQEFGEVKFDELVRPGESIPFTGLAARRSDFTEQAENVDGIQHLE